MAENKAEKEISALANAFSKQGLEDIVIRLSKLRLSQTPVQIFHKITA